jgi:hypothetical protein
VNLHHETIDLGEHAVRAGVHGVLPPRWRH